MNNEYDAVHKLRKTDLKKKELLIYTEIILK